MDSTLLAEQIVTIDKKKARKIGHISDRSIQKQIEQNRCAMACQGCGIAFLFSAKKQWKASPKSSIVKLSHQTIKQDRPLHCL